MTPEHLKGMTVARFIKAMGVSRGEPMGALAYAQGQGWRNTPGVVESLQAAAVNPMDTDNASSLIGDAQRDLYVLTHNRTILGRTPGTNHVPTGTDLLTQSAYTTAGWVGQGRATPMTRASFSRAALEPLKVGAAVVFTDALMRTSNPNAEAIISRDLSGAVVQAMDSAFIDVNNAGVPGLTPAAITHGVTPRPSSGGSLANIDADLDAMLNELADAGSSLEFGAWVMRPRTAIYLSKLRGTGGNLAYPLVTARGGSLFGLPVLTSANVPVSADTDEVSQITLLDGSRVTIADDREAEISVSKNATVQMQSEPETGATELVSLWQNNMVGMKVIRFANWKARGQAAAVLSGVAY